ncbi:hypothetical protein, partial [Amycolatopsis lexingtonensis]|uniref:hypothetical protein n=1 Tax=Amycolatopsis lexingtonensis TaxID=218822 RepID=UPI001B80A62F
GKVGSARPIRLPARHERVVHLTRRPERVVHDITAGIPAKSRGRATLPPVTRSLHVLNDSFRSSEVLNDSFKTLAHRCRLHRRDFAGAIASSEVNDSFMTSRTGFGESRGFRRRGGVHG